MSDYLHNSTFNGEKLIITFRRRPLVFDETKGVPVKIKIGSVEVLGKKIIVKFVNERNELIQYIPNIETTAALKMEVERLLGEI